MSKQEIIERIANIEDKYFYLKMKDRWNNEDYNTANRYSKELRELNKALETVC